MCYVLVIDGVVVQKRPEFKEGFIKAPSSVVCGMLHINGEFLNPPVTPPEKSWEELRQEAYEAKGWVTAFDLIEDIMRRGQDVVEAEREVIKQEFPKPE